ncbi:signal transduction histidine kinase, LytS [Pseudopedobacter saltans DSM 12145]|uniref:Signal transduction histidine kinase, LytS n=1 Tax=Pseudopedobacter saltans (strain ATCC 51119 / DSM 12145 / JCM 21818 / CCUG 39354 / LMG 10337 / NBRC 100064 / NCIMB 13643) TaxID=762903 RepID=F0S4R2_PSESL|nr:histidine kinase [Pseudopedobacter saltans]ADY53080.1 signal transduction histidine kinase, LytS [Pseudopedobacter saltans DSM 12145]
MKKITFIFLYLIIWLPTINAQKGINFSRYYAAGGKLLMCVDSAAKNVYYHNIFPNQPNTTFNYLPDANNASIQINFRRNINVPNFRYTILVDDKPILVNQSINQAKLKDTHAGGDEEIFRSTSLGTFPIKNKVITVLVFSIEKPIDIDKSVFYGKLIPRAKILGFSKRFKTEKGVDYNRIMALKDSTKLIFTQKDDELTIYKDKSDIDYVYYTTIKDKQTNKIIFESTAWQYGGVVDKHEFVPYINIDRSIFKKSGDYEIIIQPLIKWNNCFNCDTSPKEIEKHITRHTLSIILDEENYTKKELFIYTLIVALSIGLTCLSIIYIIKKRNKKRLAQKEQQKNIAKLQLNSIRSQLNPHFLFNALSGIQNLMNKNEIDNANKYLSKFARLTRNVLDDKELISLSQEKKLLDDYLQMEQLRFGFQYEINHSENLDLDNIEIPSMLLQPFVENAVKHGISQKAADGKITITFIKQANDLMLTVSDNGNGFDTEKRNIGLGMQLSDSRIALLNSIYKKNRFNLTIQSSTKGTEIDLTLTDWL